VCSKPKKILYIEVNGEQTAEETTLIVEKILKTRMEKFRIMRNFIICIIRCILLRKIKEDEMAKIYSSHVRD
jgi:hypothetical protein